MRAWGASAGLAIVLAASACASTATESVGGDSAAVVEADLRPELAQMNDVSILFPLGKGALTATGAISQASYESAFGPEGKLGVGGTAAAPKLADLRLVGARFDPCANHATADAACTNQLRLVFQTMTTKKGKTLAVDDAVHAFYDLTRPQLLGGVREVIALRRRLGGDERRLGPLAPHPLLTDDKLGDAMAAGVSAIVRSLATEANLSKLTVLTESGLGTAWNFSGADLAKDGKATTIAIPTLGGKTLVAFFAGFDKGSLTGGAGAFIPRTGAAPEDNLQLLGDVGTATRASAAEQRRAFEATLRIENPTLHSPDTIDCASCHAAEPTRTLVGEARLGLTDESSKNAFRADAKYVPAADVRPSAAPTSVNLHMFGYVGEVASIHRRTVNETAAVVAYLNAGPLAR